MTYVIPALQVALLPDMIQYYLPTAVVMSKRHQRTDKKKKKSSASLLSLEHQWQREESLPPAWVRTEIPRHTVRSLHLLFIYAQKTQDSNPRDID